MSRIEKVLIMTISTTLHEHLQEAGVHYELLSHPHTSSSTRTAAAAHVPGDKLVKSVLLEDDNGYLVAAIPATHRVDFESLGRCLHRYLSLAREDDIDKLFYDCEMGAIPPLGEAYGLKVIYDDVLTHSDDIYFEAGDHTALIHMPTAEFFRLMGNWEHGHISRHS